MTNLSRVLVCGILLVAALASPQATDAGANSPHGRQGTLT